MQFTFTESEVENNNKWSQEDDQRLEQAFKLYGPQWQKIQEFIKGKTKSECVQRWSQMKSGKKTPWTKEEDELLKELVLKYGENWNEIASIMKTRTGNQIRNRYINQIIAPPPRPWTQEEDEQLLNYYREYGSKWTQIAKLMKDRSEIQVKNRFYTKHQKELANQKPLLKLQVQDQEMEKQEEIEVKTFKTETPCKQETDQIEPEIQKKVDTKQQQILEMEHNFAYYCPRNLLTMIEKLFDPSPNEPKKFCWVPIPVLRLNKNFKVPEQSTNTKLENISDNLKQEDK